MSEKSLNTDELPMGWFRCKLLDCGDITSGGTPSTKISENWGNEVSWITPADLSGYEGKHIAKGRKSITRKGLLRSSAKLMPEGSVLFSTRAPIGYVAIASNELCTNQGFKSISPDRHLYNEFLYYFLKSAKQLAEKHASGTTFKELSLKAFSQIPIEVPPLPEQHRIVAKIEELFSELDKGVEAIKIAQQQLKVYRQAVLQQAFEGKLTEEWRIQQKNLPTASQLLEQIKTEREKQSKTTGKKQKPTAPLAEAELSELPELPNGWLYAKLADVSSYVFDGPFGSHLRSSDYADEGVRVIRLENIGSLEFRDQYKSYVTKEKYETIKKHTVYPGDLVFSSFIDDRIRVTTVPAHICFAVNKADCFCVRPQKSLIIEKCLACFLATRIAYHQLVNEIHGATRPRINTTQLKSCCVPYCSLEEQNQITLEIESRLNVADKIEESISQSLKQAEALRQSILKKAFSGKLVPQDPNDEPAEKLLARIRAERAEQPPARSRRRALR